MKAVKVGLPAVGALMLGTLLALRVTGLPPGHPSADEYSKAGRSARPGLWLTGEVVHEAVTNWDWVNQFGGPFSPKRHRTRDSYLVRHSTLGHGPARTAW